MLSTPIEKLGRSRIASFCCVFFFFFVNGVVLMVNGFSNFSWIFSSGLNFSEIMHCQKARPFDSERHDLFENLIKVDEYL